jgi:hypothetical protein
MINSLRLKWTMLVLLAVFFSGTLSLGQEINFCLMPFSQGVLQAHTSFSAIYEFDVDQNGAPQTSNQSRKLSQTLLRCNRACGSGICRRLRPSIS